MSSHCSRLEGAMAAVIILLGAGLAVIATITYSFLPTKEIKPLLCRILRKAGLMLRKEAVRGAAAAGTGEEGEEEKKKKKALVAVAVGRAELERVFSTFDKNGDGYITAAELEESLRKLGMSTSSEEVACMVEKLDTNGDGLLDLEEFWELYKSVGGGPAAEEEEKPAEGGGGRNIRIESEGEEEEETDLMEAFEVFDSNGDGLITVEELRMVLGALGLAPGVTMARCREMIEKVDVDGDGTVSFEEFKRMMKGAKDGKLF